MTPVDRSCSFCLAPLVVERITKMLNLFVNNLWITQRLVALPVDNPVDNLWITHFSAMNSVTYPVDNFYDL
jgi:hypothetical protein